MIKNGSDSSRESLLKVARLRKAKNPPVLGRLHISLECPLLCNNEGGGDTYA